MTRLVSCGGHGPVGVEGGAAASILFFDAASILFLMPPLSCFLNLREVSGDREKYRKKYREKYFANAAKAKERIYRMELPEAV